VILTKCPGKYSRKNSQLCFKWT